MNTTAPFWNVVVSFLLADEALHINVPALDERIVLSDHSLSCIGDPCGISLIAIAYLLGPYIYGYVLLYYGPGF